MGLLDGGAQAIIGSALASFYLPATLHKLPVDHNGVPTGGAAVDFPIKVQRETRSDRDRTDPNGIPNSTKFFILQLGAGTTPTVEDELTFKGLRYKIADMPDGDPADVCWTVLALKVP